MLNYFSHIEIIISFEFADFLPVGSKNNPVLHMPSKKNWLHGFRLVKTITEKRLREGKPPTASASDKAGVPMSGQAGGCLLSGWGPNDGGSLSMSWCHSLPAYLHLQIVR